MMPGYYTKTQKVASSDAQNKEFYYCLPGSSKLLKAKPDEDLDLSKEKHPLISANKELGRSICISILDMVGKNPFSRLSDAYSESALK
jgi:hypothetical protein